MGLQVGIVGLPNVGKSTLFNAVSAAGAHVANYPFATIEANVGVVALPDARLQRLAELAGSRRAVPTAVDFVDIAGLVRGASRGEGLGNQFLSRIREVACVVHVVRCFDDGDVVHVDGSVDAARDIDVVATELLLKDVETVERRAERLRRSARAGDADVAALAAAAEALLGHLEGGAPARTFPDPDRVTGIVRDLGLLTAKPVLYVANVAETDLPDGAGNAHVEVVRKLADDEGAAVLVLCAQAEAEIAELPAGERAAFLADLGLAESGLDQLVRAAYRLLGLITFFTAGETEAHAWTVRTGTTAPRAAREVHSDMERGFIRAEVIRFDDYDRLGSEQAVREAGLLRLEGRDYRVRDGDVIAFRFNV
jgi:ribosome-binding ATPase